jgi:hypothetical protein
MLAEPKPRNWAYLALALSLLANTGCERDLGNQITDTVLFALDIVDIWV